MNIPNLQEQETVVALYFKSIGLTLKFLKANKELIKSTGAKVSIRTPKARSLASAAEERIYQGMMKRFQNHEKTT